jgi:hypothetical protein
LGDALTGPAALWLGASNFSILLIKCAGAFLYFRVGRITSWEIEWEMRQQVRQFSGWAHQISQSCLLNALAHLSTFGLGASHHGELIWRCVDGAGSSLAWRIKFLNLAY